MRKLKSRKECFKEFAGEMIMKRRKHLVQRKLSNWQFGLPIFPIVLLPKPRRNHRYACVCEAVLSKKYSASNYPKLNFRCTVLRTIIVIFILWIGVHALALFYMSIDRQCISVNYNGYEQRFYYDTTANLRKSENQSKKMEILSQLDNEIKGDANEVYYVRCYVNGEKLYGVCNTLKDKFAEEDMRIADVESSYFFTYDCESGLHIEYTQKDVVGIAYMEGKLLYLREQKVCLKNMIDEKEEIIYNIQDKNDLAVEITKNALMLREVNSWVGNVGETNITDIYLP